MSNAARPVRRNDRVSLFTAICLVVANMIGTGIFTSLGFQVADIQSGFSILMLWVVGGVFAVCGALSYAELAAALPRSGGEFHFLSKIYHPGLGFLAGWVSVTAGFAAPIALGAMAFGRYSCQVWPELNLNPLYLSIALVVILTLAQMWGVSLASRVMDFLASLKVILILLLIGFGIFYGPAQPISFAPTSQDTAIIFSGAFATGLYYVMYSYSGWNAAIYIIDEVRDATKTLPRALFIGTLFVLGIYVLVTWVFLRTTPIEAMKNQIDVAFVVAKQIFGPSGGRWIAALISLALLSFVNAMIWTGPSVLKVMGEDFPALRLLAHRTAHNVPSYAMYLQFGIVLFLLLSATFDQVIFATGFALTACSLFAAVGVLILRWKQPNLPRPYKVWAYPWTPLLFALISLFMLFYGIKIKLWASMGGFCFLLLGMLLYLWTQRNPQPLPDPPA